MLPAKKKKPRGILEENQKNIHRHYLLQNNDDSHGEKPTTNDDDNDHDNYDTLKRY